MFQPLSASSLSQFIQLPDVIQLTYLTTEGTLSSTTAEGCAALIKSTTIAIQFYSNTCTSFAKVTGFNTRSMGKLMKTHEN